MGDVGVSSGRDKLAINRDFNLHQSCFTHVHWEKRWGKISSSILQNEVVLLKSNSFLFK